MRELHDRWWSSRGIQVVRPGGVEVAPRGPTMYLLLGEQDLVVLGFGRITKKMNWLRPRLLRLRLVESASKAYVERVHADESDRFIAIRREYRAETRTTLRAGVTGDAKVAERWRESDTSSSSAWRGLARWVGREKTAALAHQARILSASDPDERDECVSLLLERWSDPGSALDEVYEFDHGIWMHVSARVDPEKVRLTPPLWIGAGVEFEAGDVVVGPRAVCDEPGVETASSPMAWEAVRYPGWRPTPRLRGRWFRVSKRLFDIGFSAAVLLGTLPLYPPIMLAILLEDGRPFFFAHRRQTRRGREFPCYKFRTMCKDAEKLKRELAAKNQVDGPQFYIADDPRLLRVGRFLRRFQLDELPQFWNVLLGHMSVVGPRPSPDSENQFCPAWREARLSVRPGVTGLWQVRRTREPGTDFQEWIRYDLEYVQHESWRLDLWIIIKTIQKVFFG